MYLTTVNDDNEYIDKHCSTCDFNQKFHFEMPCLNCNNFNKWQHDKFK